MKRILIILCLNLLIHNVAFSQNTYPKILNDSLIVITQQQLKETNLIFLEHQKLLKKDSIYKSQITSLNEAIKISIELDSVYNSTLDNYYRIIKEKEMENESLNKKYKRAKKFSGACLIGGGSIITVLLLLLL